MHNIYRLVNTANQAASDLHNAVSQNLAVSQSDPLKIKTETALVGAKYGQGIELELRAAIDEKYTADYIKALSPNAEDKILEQYASSIVQLFEGENASLFDIFNQVQSSLRTLHASANEQNSFGGVTHDYNDINAAKALDSLRKAVVKLNSIEKGLQQLRAKADSEIAKELSQVNALMKSARSAVGVLNSCSKDPKASLMSIEAEKQLWRDTVELAKYFSVGRGQDMDGRQIINVKTDKEVYPIVSSTYNVDFHYQNHSFDSLHGDEVFEPIVLTRYGANTNKRRPFEDFEVVSSGKSVKDTTYKIKSGIIGGLLKVRDEVVVNALEECNKLTRNMVDELNTLYNNLNPLGGSKSLIGSKIMEMETELGSRGEALIVLVDSEGKVPMDLLDPEARALDNLIVDMHKMSKIGDTSVRALMNNINSHFSPDSRGVELGGLRDLKLVSVVNEGKVSLGFQADGDKRAGVDITIKKLKVKNGDGQTLDASLLDSQGSSVDSVAYQVEAGSKQQLLSSLGIRLPNDLSSLYVVEVEVEVKDDAGRVKRDVMSYNIDLGSNPLHSVGTLFSIDSLKVAEGNTEVQGRVKFHASGLNLKASLQEGCLSLAAGSGHKVIVKHVQPGFQEKNTANSIKSRGFSDFFGLNDLFRSKGKTHLSDSRNPAKDIAIRKDIEKNAEILTSYIYEVSQDGTLREGFFPKIDAGIGSNGLRFASQRELSFISEIPSEYKSKQMALENTSNIVKSIEHNLNLKHGLTQFEAEGSIMMATHMQQAVATMLQNYKDMMELFFRAIS